MAEQLLSARSCVSKLSPQRELAPCYYNPPSPQLTELPIELLVDIANRLGNSDIKNLRLACKLLASTSTLRISRVFLSANPLNVEVFRAIADHETFRHGVIEIIYDDARLPRSAYEDASARRPDLLRYSGSEQIGVQTNENWFNNERQQNIQEIGRHEFHTGGQWDSPARVEQAAAEMSMQASWTYYQDLVRQQDEVIANDSDLEALRYGLRQFSSLQTVIITPAAHGLLFSPLYKTPMIRGFPPGFNYPIPRGWPARHEGQSSFGAAAWINEEDTIWAERVRGMWRGCQIVARALAQEHRHHHVSEFLIDSNQLLTGLNCRLFEQRCKAYNDIVSVLKHPGLRRFDLSLHIDGQQQLSWPAFRSGLLRRALAKAVDLEHFSFAADTDPDIVDEGDSPPLLETYLPIDRWPRLQHLRLWNLSVKKVELLSFLAKIPPTLSSLELGRLIFSDNGDYRSLLSDIRRILRWQEREIRPRFKIALPRKPYYRDGQAVWLEKEVNEFLYGHAVNPFDARLGLNRVRQGVGVIRDAFIADYEKPCRTE
nr:F-box domain protein [Trichoderma asperellum]